MSARGCSVACQGPVGTSHRWLGWPLLLGLLVLAGCGNQPRQPDWLVNADGGQERYVRAFLAGQDRVAASEFTRLRTEVSATGRPALVARVELTRCAVQVASLDLSPCAAFDALRADAGDAERAYADFLAGTGSPEQAKLLPEAYRGVAGGPGGAAALQAITDPVSRLVAAGVLLRTRRADPQVLQLAADTASQQGWRRPLLAWLGVLAMRAEQAGATEEAQRLRRRMAIAAGER